MVEDWFAVRHNRHTRWPLVSPFQHLYNLDDDDSYNRESLNTSESNSDVSIFKSISMLIIYIFSFYFISF